MQSDERPVTWGRETITGVYNIAVMAVPPERPTEPNTIVSFQSTDAVCTASWILWCSSAPGEQASVHEEVDTIFSDGFAFYPELEWRSRYPPPQGYKVLGAWRDPLDRGISFLLDNPGMTPPPGTGPLLLHYAGARAELTHFLPNIQRLKRALGLTQKQLHRLGEMV